MKKFQVFFILIGEFLLSSQLYSQVNTFDEVVEIYKDYLEKIENGISKEDLANLQKELEESTQKEEALQSELEALKEEAKILRGGKEEGPLQEGDLALYEWYPGKDNPNNSKILAQRPFLIYVNVGKEYRNGLIQVKTDEGANRNNSTAKKLFENFGPKVVEKNLLKKLVEVSGQFKVGDRIAYFPEKIESNSGGLVINRKAMKEGKIHYLFRNSDEVALSRGESFINLKTSRAFLLSH